MDQTAIIAVLLTALSLGALLVIRLNRSEEIADEISDTDSRTAALVEALEVSARGTGGRGRIEQRPSAEDAIARHGTAL